MWLVSSSHYPDLPNRAKCSPFFEADLSSSPITNRPQRSSPSPPSLLFCSPFFPLPLPLPPPSFSTSFFVFFSSLLLCFLIFFQAATAAPSPWQPTAGSTRLHGHGAIGNPSGSGGWCGRTASPWTTSSGPCLSRKGKGSLRRLSLYVCADDYLHVPWRSCEHPTPYMCLFVHACVARTHFAMPDKSVVATPKSPPVFLPFMQPFFPPVRS